MSGLALFRPAHQYDDLQKIANEHFKHDLGPEDRETLKSASKKIPTHTMIGSMLGLGLGVYAAVRLRRVRADMFASLRAAEKPVKVIFADGRTEAVPDISPLLQGPSRFGDWATTFFFGLGGLFLGGESGFLTGSWSAARTITVDPGRQERIEKAYRNFRIDVLKKEIEKLEAGHPVFGDA
ncbi:hypothetical protein DL546_009008 [Coniochaeta pulveracea]|uniref:Uncharacterized protein n=1 Tax=Coniochaeta pulveracea TaxID=177199 RepID=A0A420YIJ0_9PEZI|nr:hypothetical protein DL546_009008 [Coniochaeta pulveracea]